MGSARRSYLKNEMLEEPSKGLKEFFDVSWLHLLNWKGLFPDILDLPRPKNNNNHKCGPNKDHKCKNMVL